MENKTEGTAAKTPAAKKVAFTHAEDKEVRARAKGKSAEEVAMARLKGRYSDEVGNTMGGFIIGATGGGVVGGIVGGVLAHKKLGLEGDALVRAAALGTVLGTKAGVIVGLATSTIYNKVTR